MKKNNTSIDMELTVEGLGETLKVINGFLMVGNEYDNSRSSVCLEDISQVQNKELVSKLEELHKYVSEATIEIKKLAIEAYKKSDAQSHLEWMVEGALDEVEESKAS